MSLNFGGAVEDTDVDKAKGQLVRLDEARKALAKIASVDEAKKIRDQAEALRNYAKQQQLGLESQNSAAEIKIRAERRAGELCSEIERKDTQANLKCGPKRQRDAPGQGYRETIEAAGISEPSARRWQNIAKIPQPAFEAYVHTAKERGDELTSADTARFAKEVSPGVVQQAQAAAKRSPSVVISKVISTLSSVIVLLKSAKRSKMSDDERKEIRSTIKRIRNELSRIGDML